MFERYTESARRSIFFGRYEASLFGSLFVETEHLLLGLLREDKALAERFLGSLAAIDSIREHVEAHTPVRDKIPTSVDLPLSHECTRVLAHADEEAKRLSHENILTAHLLLGVLAEEKSFAAQLLREQGLTLDSARGKVRHPGESRFLATVDRWLAECEARGRIWSVRKQRVANSTTDFAIYAGDPPVDDGSGDGQPFEKLAQIQHRTGSLIAKIEDAIAHREFEKARSYSDQERQARENLRLLREQGKGEEPPSQVPLLCIHVVDSDRLGDVQRRCDNYLAIGVAQVWILDPVTRRAYTAIETEGLREVKASTLELANPPLSMDLNRIFAEHRT